MKVFSFMALMAIALVGCERAPTALPGPRSERSFTPEARGSVAAPVPETERNDAAKVARKVTGQDVLFPSTRELADRYTEGQREVFTENYQRALDEHHRKQEEKLGDTLPRVSVGRMERQQPMVERSEIPAAEPEPETPGRTILVGK